MRSYRDEFPKWVKEAALERANGICECGCLQPFGQEGIIYAHDLPAALGGPGTLENCKVHRKACELRITTQRDRPMIDKAKRGLEKRLGLRTSRYRPMAGGRATKWKRKMSGEWVVRHGNKST